MFTHINISLTRQRRPAFTLVEMTIVIMIIAIMAAMALPVVNAAYQQSRVHRTRAVIAKIDTILTEKWEAYKTRQVPIRVLPGTPVIGEPFADTPANADLTNGIWDNGESYIDTAWRDANGDGVINNSDRNNQYDRGAADLRMIAMRELQRCELPNLMADVLVNPVTIARPAVSKHYLRRVTASWSIQFEGAECLYLILAATRDNDKSALDFFSPSEIGDTDGDGMNEIHDAWGNPIEFVRWPFGYSETPGPDGEWGVAGNDDDGDGVTDNPSEAGYGDDKKPVTPQSRNFHASKNPFDPSGADGRTRNLNTFVIPVSLKPLVYSPGPDKVYAIQKLFVNNNPSSSQISDPYRVEFASGRRSPGSPFDVNGRDGYADNITNHDLEAR